jgi:uncharacterized membrane protein YkvA (DUF1232 family)
MKDFQSLLKEKISDYEGRHDDIIYLAPDFYSLLTNLLDDARLPNKMRPLLSCAIAYFILPADVISEDIYGPYGYIDDIFLSALVADAVRRETFSEHILVDNWEGETEIIPLVDEILAKESELIGDQRMKILHYTGCDQLLGGSLVGTK